MSRTSRTHLQVPSTVSLPEARDNLLALDEKLALIPAPARTSLLAAIDVLLTEADSYPDGLRGIVDHAFEIIAAASGVARADHTKFLPSAQCEALHLHRNLLMAVVLAGVIEYDGDPRPIVAAFPTLKPRTPMSTRAHTDDEMLLLQLWVLHMCKRTEKDRRSAAVFANVRAGMVAGETTRVIRDDADLDALDPIVLAPGHSGGLAPRFLTLDPFAVHVLTNYTAHRTFHRGELLTYQPRKATGYSSACASAVGVLDRIRDAVGLKHADTTASSVWMWRIATTIETHGRATALKVSGRSSHDNLNGLMRQTAIRHTGSRKARKTLDIQ